MQKITDEDLKALLHSEIDKIITLGSDGLTEEDVKVFLDTIRITICPFFASIRVYVIISPDIQVSLTLPSRRYQPAQGPGSAHL